VNLSNEEMDNFIDFAIDFALSEIPSEEEARLARYLLDWNE